MENLANKVALVTGASRGIGARIARELALAGAKVIVNYAGNKSAAEAVVGSILESGGQAVAVKADVSKASEVKGLFDQAIGQYGRIDVLVNNAGVILYKPIKETTEDELAKIIDVNIKGVFNTLREAATRLSDNGSIINFSSSVNRLIMPTYGAYVATKSAVEQLTRVFAKEIGHRNINVNSISPGPTNTELFLDGKSEETISRLAGLSAFNRIGEPEDIARVVVFLASDNAKWISAQNIGVNGGMA
ncbi:MAG: 3-ketoacyl-ACP reductase [Dyadobacter sp. 50-39]|uniref:SDR family oxidoreductase n=1 Tax=Dyadobacter sp. 50-39 TaxID=1895756 RepID=UPI0009643AEE|nr:SDR family oxidoreductase [Dyadobacter sp. 50-39]OJV13062.1 MAG: 3-ketoacyl-ACP reductase [Dyadobacter sp. 50-39]